MSGYVRNLKLKMAFDGDDLEITMNHLEWADFRALAEAPREEAIGEFSKMLPRYITALRGLNDAAGAPIPVTEMCTMAYFLPVVGACFKFLMKESVLKNLQAFGETSTVSSPEAIDSKESSPVDTERRIG